jgi:hypothetical protein
MSFCAVSITYIRAFAQIQNLTLYKLSNVMGKRCDNSASVRVGGDS